ncbi:TrmH family RNA methyltransferase [Marinirhabdus gelatinilytica]|uniref:TrmH family RNA methyltransferase n=1 Tax=Marinirhabdus gelatinilytica TaxID=1703343 RepID=A0A370Q753_9FLAO|nr:TrmH family RNA methyltransferase [Marinirhabdus gelatinilytica]
MRTLFIAEGPKVIRELIAERVALRSLYTTEISAAYEVPATQITQQELKKISNLKTANTALAVFEKPDPQKIEDSGLIVALDAVRDPGNLGTIIRLCDWFGVAQLLCSQDTADCYNPKVIQATMGSIARVSVHYVSLEETFRNSTLPIFGAFMDGSTVYKKKLPQEGIIVMGNEANGISDKISALISERISIPQFGKTTTESLNVATATAILLSEFKRAY